MATAAFRNPVLDESVDLVDRSSVNDRTFGVVKARRHPAYVHGVNKNACLMHKVRDVELHYYAVVSVDGPGSHLGRLKQPYSIAHTVCGYAFALTADRARTCTVPKPDAVLCGRCHGQPPTFRRSVASTAAKRAAKVTLGCEIAGYPSALSKE